MKHFFLLFLALLSYTGCSYGQKDNFVRTQQNIFTVSYHPESTDSIRLPNIQILPDTARLDTCYWNNSAFTNIKIKNDTPYELVIAKELTCWDDSGFRPVLPANSDLIFRIQPGRQEEITILLMNSSRRTYHKSGTYYLLCNQHFFSGSIRVKMQFKPNSCRGN